MEKLVWHMDRTQLGELHWSGGSMGYSRTHGDPCHHAFPVTMVGSKQDNYMIWDKTNLGEPTWTNCILYNTAS